MACACTAQYRVPNGHPNVHHPEQSMCSRPDLHHTDSSVAPALFSAAGLARNPLWVGSTRRSSIRNKLRGTHDDHGRTGAPPGWARRTRAQAQRLQSPHANGRGVCSPPPPSKCMWHSVEHAIRNPPARWQQESQLQPLYIDSKPCMANSSFAARLAANPCTPPSSRCLVPPGRAQPQEPRGWDCWALPSQRAAVGSPNRACECAMEGPDLL